VPLDRIEQEHCWHRTAITVMKRSVRNVHLPPPRNILQGAGHLFCQWHPALADVVRLHRLVVASLTEPLPVTANKIKR
jgi:hypothetical protein